MSNISVGTLLKKYRREKMGLTVREAAEVVDLHYTYLSRIENDISEPSDDVLNKIAKKYKLNDEEGAELFYAAKVSPSFAAALQKLSEDKVAELMHRKRKK